MKRKSYSAVYVQDLKRQHQQFESGARKEFEILTKDRDYQRGRANQAEHQIEKLTAYAEKLEQLVGNQRQSIAIMQRLLDGGKP